MAQNGDLQLFASLARALAHAVRGDLSVILNDLAYFGTILPASEIERSKGRCGNISRTLSKLSSLKDGHVVVKDYACKDILALLDTDTDSTWNPDLPEKEDRYLADLDALSSCLKVMRTLVEQRVASGSKVTEIANREARALLISISGNSESLLQERYLSATEYATAELGEAFVVEAVILDLLLRAQGMSVSFGSDSHHNSAVFRLTGRVFVQRSIGPNSEAAEVV